MKLSQKNPLNNNLKPDDSINTTLTGDVVLRCCSLGKHYRQGNSVIDVFKDIELVIKKGESIAIMGASGSGKSTLLNLLGGLDHADTGHVEVMGRNLESLTDKSLSLFRNQHIGFVYQLHHLLMEFSAIENTMMPLLIAGETKKVAEEKSRNILHRVGLSERLQHRPSALSGGERQRVAIARALVMQPDCVLMDEPTGNLDADTAKTIFDLILELRKELSLSFVIVTHDKHLAEQAETICHLQKGRLIKSIPSASELN